MTTMYSANDCENTAISSKIAHFSQCEWLRTDSVFEQKRPILPLRMTANRQRFRAKYVTFRSANNSEKTAFLSKIGQFLQCEWLRKDSDFDQNRWIFAVRMTAKRHQFQAKCVNFRSANTCEQTVISSEIGHFSQCKWLRKDNIFEQNRAIFANNSKWMRTDHDFVENS